MVNLRKIALGLFVGTATLGMASPASAALTTIAVTGTAITVGCTDSVAPISDPVCGGISGGSLSSPSAGTIGSSADLYDLPDSSESSEAQALDILLDGLDDDDWIGTDGSNTDAGGVGTLSFDTDAKYILFKIGNASSAGKHFFLSILSPGVINISFDKNGQKGGGFSHYAEFGSFSAVPVPAAAWLFGTALLGFIGISRRTKV